MGLHILKRYTLVLALLAGPVVGFAAVRSVAVIAGDDFPAQKLSVDEVAKIYKGERLFLKGTRLTPLDNRDNGLRSRFFQEAFGMSTDDFAVHWITRNFQDGLKIPEALTTTEVFDRVKEKGVLGFVDADDLKGRSGVRTLLTLDAP